MITTCQYKNHEVPPTSLYRYYDAENGIPLDGINACHECLAEHVLKFYPNSKLAANIKANPKDFKNN